jgi:glucose-6-phosphate 1-dehydrogenase
LAAKRTEVAIQFKRAPFSMFRGTEIEHFSPNDLVIGIEPTEGVTLQFNTKVPGQQVVIDGVEMTFRYKDYFKIAPSTGYETLIYDCMVGDNILFQRADGIEAGWQAVEPVLNAWRHAGANGLYEYTAGTEGPDAADDLIRRDGRRWRSVKGG